MWDRGGCEKVESMYRVFVFLRSKPDECIHHFDTEWVPQVGESISPLGKRMKVVSRSWDMDSEPVHLNVMLDDRSNLVLPVVSACLIIVALTALAVVQLVRGLTIDL